MLSVQAVVYYINRIYSVGFGQLLWLLPLVYWLLDFSKEMRQLVKQENQQSRKLKMYDYMANYNTLQKRCTETRRIFFYCYPSICSILTQIPFNLCSISSYHLAIISSFITNVVPWAIIPASIIAPQHLRSLLET